MRRLRRDLGRRLNLDLDARELLVELADLERRERLEEACAERWSDDTAAVSLARRVDDVEAARHRLEARFPRRVRTRAVVRARRVAHLDHLLRELAVELGRRVREVGLDVDLCGETSETTP